MPLRTTLTAMVAGLVASLLLGIAVFGWYPGQHLPEWRHVLGTAPALLLGLGAAVAVVLGGNLAARMAGTPSARSRAGALSGALAGLWVYALVGHVAAALVAFLPKVPTIRGLDPLEFAGSKLLGSSILIEGMLATAKNMLLAAPALVLAGAVLGGLGGLLARGGGVPQAAGPRGELGEVHGWMALAATMLAGFTWSAVGGSLYYLSSQFSGLRAHLWTVGLSDQVSTDNHWLLAAQWTAASTLLIPAALASYMTGRVLRRPGRKVIALAWCFLFGLWLLVTGSRWGQTAVPSWPAALLLLGVAIAGAARPPSPTGSRDWRDVLSAGVITATLVAAALPLSGISFGWQSGFSFNFMIPTLLHGKAAPADLTHNVERMARFGSASALYLGLVALLFVVVLEGGVMLARHLLEKRRGTPPATHQP